MSKYVKNNDSSVRTWCGMEIQAAEYYLIQSSEESRWANDSIVFDSISDNTLIVSKTNESGGHITDHATAINYLKGDIFEVDSQGRQITRTAAGQKGWSYLGHPTEFCTAKFSSLYEKKYTNSDRGSATLKFYDANDAEVTDAQYETSIVKTVLTIKPTHDYEILAGSMHHFETPTSDVRVWVVGGVIGAGIPFTEPYIKEFCGGVNLRFFGASEQLKTDGRAAKYMVKDTAGVPYQTNQLQLIVRHNAGYQHDIMLVVEYFRA